MNPYQSPAIVDDETSEREPLLARLWEQLWWDWGPELVLLWSANVVMAAAVGGMTVIVVGRFEFFPI